MLFNFISIVFILWIWFLGYCKVKWLVGLLMTWLAPIVAPVPFPQSQPLPENPYPQGSKAHAAYDLCLHSQFEASDNARLLMYARCLGYLIIEAPNDAARNYISHEIIRSSAQMNELAQFYITHLFRLLRRDKGLMPSPRHSSHEEEGFIFSNFSSKALERDNFRCMATRHVDMDYYESLSNIDRTAVTSILTSTNFCYIFPPSTSWNSKPERSSPKTHSVENVWAIVLNYGLINVLNDFHGSDGHQLSNGLTLTRELCTEFDRLRLWFEAIPNTEHTYRVCTLYPCFRPSEFLPPSRIVTFTTTTNLPLPDPRYLKLHAVICRAGHLSGITEYLSRYDREQERRNFLAHDGSSAEYLASLLLLM